jgi:hypothetical protein
MRYIGIVIAEGLGERKIKKEQTRQLTLLPDKLIFGEVLIGIKRIINWLYQAEQTRDITLENDIFCIFI